MSQPTFRKSHLCWLGGLLWVCTVLTACKPREIPVACTPLPIVDGYETAMTEGGKMRLRVPKHSVTLTENCKEIKSVELVYFWHKGQLVWRDDNQFNPDISKESLSHPIKIYSQGFKLRPEVEPVTLKPWQFEGAVRHYKYPLEFYPKFYWTAPDQQPAKAPSTEVWGVVGTHSPIVGYPFATLCAIVRSAGEPHSNPVTGDFPKDYSDASCRGGIDVVKGDKVFFGLIDVWYNNAHDIDQIYNAAIAKIQTYINEE